MYFLFRQVGLIFHLQFEAQRAKIFLFFFKSLLQQQVSQQQLRINPVIIWWDRSPLLMLPWETEKG